MLTAASQRDAVPPAAATAVVVDEPQHSTPKADRLPLFVPVVDKAGPITAPPQRTEDRREHRWRDICEHGRRYFRIGRHQYWRCRRR